MKLWMTGEIFNYIDFFGMRLPNFHLKRREEVTTRLGGIVTILMTTIVLMYSGLKLSHLIGRHMPVMSSYYKNNYYKDK